LAEAGSVVAMQTSDKHVSALFL